MKNTAPISVIISLYNEKGNFEESINSILNQTVDVEEIIVIDDGSTDGTWRKLKTLYSCDEKVRLYKNDENIGLPKSLNKAINRANGEFIARQDAEEVSHHQRIERQFDALLCSSCSVIGCETVKKRPKDIEDHRFEKEYAGDTKVDIVRREYPHHGSLMFYTELLKQEKYDTELLYSQDRDLLIRLRKMGVRIGMLREQLYLVCMELVDEKSYQQYCYKLKAENKIKMYKIHRSTVFKKVLKPLYEKSNYFEKKSLTSKNKLRKILFKALSVVVYPIHYIERTLIDPAQAGSLRPRDALGLSDRTNAPADDEAVRRRI